jgi:ketosteroid isomerase-like protein
MTVGYADGGRLLAALAQARTDFDGDAFVALFGDDAEYHVGPFAAPLVGHNALRAWLLDAASVQRDVDFTVEQHWVSGRTVLAAWHLTYVRRTGADLIRVAGFLAVDVAPDGRIERLRQWSETASTD